MTELRNMAERAARTRGAMAERPAPAAREDLKGRVLREAEWLNPALARAPGAGERGGR